VAAVLRDLHWRNVLCNTSFPCSVVLRGSRLEICLPSDPASRASHVCEPWGEPWQQRGMRVDNFSETGCAHFSLPTIERWKAELRAHSPFLGSDDPRVRELMARKANLPPGALAAFRRLLPPSGTRAKSRRLRRCAVVGSAHSLICHKPQRGSEIDRHDGVWRSNAAQHYNIHNGSDVGQLMRASRRSFRGFKMLDLLHTRGPIFRAGARTDFRVNALYDSFGVSHDETIVVSSAWFKQPWGTESFMNLRNPCCNRIRIRSNYTAAHLLQLVADGFRVRFLRPPSTGDDALDGLLGSSGGNALYGAVAACDEVNLYGAGLYSDGPRDTKRYLHFYNLVPGVADCVNDTARRAARFMRKRTVETRREWVNGRVRTELLLHVLHALKVINWIQ
jgi:hypothetical protein